MINLQGHLERVIDISLNKWSEIKNTAHWYQTYERDIQYSQYQCYRVLILRILFQKYRLWETNPKLIHIFHKNNCPLLVNVFVYLTVISNFIEIRDCLSNLPSNPKSDMGTKPEVTKPKRSRSFDYTAAILDLSMRSQNAGKVWN